MSIIPKISVGLPTKREKRNLNFDCSTTSNLGNVQPTMCREMVPKETYKVKVSSLVRLASMPLPTFGRMSLRHHHVFVPIEDLYGAWNALLSGQHYQAAGGAIYVPVETPFFHMNDVTFIERILAFCDISIAPESDINNPYTITDNNVDWAGTVYSYGEDETYATYEAAVAAAQAADKARVVTALQAILTYGASNKAGAFGKKASIRLRPASYFPYTSQEDAGGLFLLGSMVSNAYSGMTTPQLNASFEPATSKVGVITPEGADYILGINNYNVLCKMKPMIKRLRTIFIGLGYQFSPYNPEKFNPFKLIAYYKAWFSLFRPDREKTWVDTNAYKVIKQWDRSSGLDCYLNFQANWDAFLDDLMKDCFYYLPMDYYSMAQLRPQQSMSDAGGASAQSFHLQPGVNVDQNGQLATQDLEDYAVGVNNGQAAASKPSVAMNSANGSISPVALKLAQRILRYANKNTVIGRNIRDYLKVHYGVSDPNCDQDIEGVIRIGSSRININISDVMSTAENQEGFLGEYAGKGIGYGDSDTFSFTADKFGYWITLTTIVPESGYYQGYLRENRHLTRYDFFMPEFDALGYQVLERGEIMDDYNCDWIRGNGIETGFNPNTDILRSKAFGFVPRYSEYKTGRNIVNGDLSLIGLYNSMAAYTLDRRISAGLMSITARDYIRNHDSMKIVAPNFIPTLVYDDFRKIDPTDHLGQYNRIFNYTLNDLDHFIIHNVFDVSAMAPMKSLSRSFDTYSEEDDTSIDVTKA